MNIDILKDGDWDGAVMMILLGFMITIITAMISELICKSWLIFFLIILFSLLLGFPCGIFVLAKYKIWCRRNRTKETLEGKMHSFFAGLFVGIYRYTVGSLIIWIASKINKIATKIDKTVSKYILEEDI